MRNGGAKVGVSTLCRWRWTLGGVGVRARKAIDIAVAHARIHHGNALYDRTLSRRSLLQRLQVAVMRGVARQLLRRLVGGEEVVESGVD